MIVADLDEVTDVSEPFPRDSDRLGALERSGELRAWIVPQEARRQGANVFELMLASGASATVVVVDIAVFNSARPTDPR